MAEIRAVSRAQAELLMTLHLHSETAKLLLHTMQEEQRKLAERLELHHDALFIGNSTPALRTQLRELTTAVAALQAQLKVMQSVPAITLPSPPRTGSPGATGATGPPGASGGPQTALRIALISAVTTIATAFIAGAVAWHAGGKLTRLLYWLVDPGILPWGR